MTDRHNNTKNNASNFRTTSSEHSVLVIKANLTVIRPRTDNQWNSYRNKQASMQHRRNVRPCYYSIHTFVHIRPWALTSNLENLFSNAHSHDEYLWQVLPKSLQ